MLPHPPSTRADAARVRTAVRVRRMVNLGWARPKARA
jgi:hypothetical protein